MARVVVTGLGVQSPIGLSVKEAWTRLLNGECGIRKLTDPQYEKLPCHIAATTDPSLEIHFSKSDLRTMSPATALGLLAAEEAIRDANWSPTNDEDLNDTGVAVGVGMVDLNDICQTNKDLEGRGYNRVSPYFIPRILPNMVAGHISIKFGFRGPNHAVSTACATGAHAIGDAFRFIQRGDSKIMVAGGAEKCISPLAIAGFCRLRALSTNFNEAPLESSRPFDGKRDGFVMGEGAAILVLEEHEHAVKRGAKIYAEVLGYGLSGDASHLTAPREDGTGAVLAMTRALKDAKLQPKDIGYVNAHATSTPLGDIIEAKAISSIFPQRIQVSSTKGSHGHLLGAAGNLESVFTILACQTGTIPPTINQNSREEKIDLNVVANQSAEWEVGGRRVALKNAFGFGGTNACLCFAEYREGDS